MFKTVEYVGFEGQPELRAKAERATEVLADEIRTWREDVEVRWTPSCSQASVLELTLSLTLPNGVSGTLTGGFTRHDLEQDSWMASRCGRVWSDLLGILLRHQDERIKDILHDTVEV